MFDAFCLRLTDRNSKVNLHALQAFSSMVPVMHTALVPIINNIMGTLVPNLASRNLTIHSTAMTVLDLMAQHMGKGLCKGIMWVANAYATVKRFHTRHTGLTKYVCH